MRFRLPEWDIAMPDCLVSYWQAWNETDLAKVPSHLALAVTHEVEWNDPNDSFVGVAALIEAINVFRTKRPRFRFVIVSEIDHQHDRLRYRWDMRNRGRTLMEGLDIVTLDRDVGLIRRSPRRWPNGLRRCGAFTDKGDAIWPLDCPPLSMIHPHDRLAPIAVSRHRHRWHLHRRRSVVGSWPGLGNRGRQGEGPDDAPRPRGRHFRRR